MGYAAKVRPAVVLSIPIEDDEQVLTTIVPHTPSVRGTRFETPSDVRWLKEVSFDWQGIWTYIRGGFLCSSPHAPAEGSTFSIG